MIKDSPSLLPGDQEADNPFKPPEEVQAVYHLMTDHMLKRKNNLK